MEIEVNVDKLNKEIVQLKNLFESCVFETNRRYRVISEGKTSEGIQDSLDTSVELIKALAYLINQTVVVLEQAKTGYVENDTMLAELLEQTESEK